MASKSFPCAVCPTQIFRNEAGLSKHYSEVHKDGQILCPQCNMSISKIQHLKRHLQIHESNQIRGFKCTVGHCPKSFYTFAGVKQHIRVHSTERPFPCSFQCGMRFKTKADVNRHILSHTKKKPYKCEECDASFCTKSHLQRHTKYQHAFPDAKPYGCTHYQCGMKFQSNQALKRHIQRIHTIGTKNFFCSVCSMKYLLKSDLTQHFKTHGQSTKRKLVSCYFCSKSLTPTQHLVYHLRVHTNEKPFICAEKSCNYSATQPSTLRHHVLKIHSAQERKHSCYFCLATFTDKRVVVNHMRIHTLEKPFSCKLCRKSFKKLSNLSYHIHYNHTKEKPHKCGQCEKSFSFNEELKNHTATHRGEKRFFCDFCSYSSYYHGNFKTHCEKVHKDEKCEDVQIRAMKSVISTTIPS